MRSLTVATEPSPHGSPIAIADCCEHTGKAQTSDINT